MAEWSLFMRFRQKDEGLDLGCNQTSANAAKIRLTSQTESSVCLRAAVFVDSRSRSLIFHNTHWSG